MMIETIAGTISRHVSQAASLQPQPAAIVAGFTADLPLRHTKIGAARRLLQVPG